MIETAPAKEARRLFCPPSIVGIVADLYLILKGTVKQSRDSFETRRYARLALITRNRVSLKCGLALRVVGSSSAASASYGSTARPEERDAAILSAGDPNRGPNFCKRSFSHTCYCLLCVRDMHGFPPL